MNDESPVSAEFAQCANNTGRGCTYICIYIHIYIYAHISIHTSLQHVSKLQAFNIIEWTDTYVFQYSRTNHITFLRMVMIWTTVRQELSNANSGANSTYRPMDPTCTERILKVSCTSNKQHYKIRCVCPSNTLFCSSKACCFSEPQKPATSLFNCKQGFGFQYIWKCNLCWFISVIIPFAEGPKCELGLM